MSTSKSKPKLTRRYLTRNGPINAAFKKLPAAKKRVAIAQDALRWMKSSGVTISRGTYVEPTEMYDSYDTEAVEPKGIQCIVDAKCEVCAKGGLFMASVMRTNTISTEDVLNSGCSDIDTKVCATDKIFSQAQFDLIEYVFENGAVINETTETNVLYDLITRWNQRFPCDSVGALYPTTASARQRILAGNKLRFAAICVNIIQNKGKFVPKDIPTVFQAKRALAQA